MTPHAPNIEFDPDALREKYRAERGMRLRADGNDQYVEVRGAFAHCAEAPTSSPVTRAQR